MRSDWPMKITSPSTGGACKNCHSECVRTHTHTHTETYDTCEGDDINIPSARQHSAPQLQLQRSQSWVCVCVCVSSATQVLLGPATRHSAAGTSDVGSCESSPRCFVGLRCQRCLVAADAASEHSAKRSHSQKLSFISIGSLPGLVKRLALDRTLDTVPQAGPG